MSLRFLDFGLDDLARNREIRKPDFNMSASAKKRAYPVRAFRYWWVAHVLARRLAALPQAVIVNMGAGDGQMRRYCAGSMEHIAPGYPFAAQRWIGLDRNRSAILADSGYNQLISCDFDRPLPLDSNSVDLLVSIHVMEHLPRPEFTMSEIARVLAPGGVFCGGSPTAPALVSFFLHKWLRRRMRMGKTNSNGHINSLSPGDWKRLVRRAGLALDFVSGSHFMRVSGAFVEDYACWARANLLFGGCLPSLGSEVYLVAHKPR